MFIRLFQPRERKEILVNVNHVSKIEIEYAVPGNDGNYWLTSLDHGISNPDAVRFYRVFVAGEEILLPSNPNDSVVRVFEEIYKNSIKGPDDQSEPGPADAET
ncbi:MAG: hypothetical protein ACK5A3_24270 [Planctomyces sp.]|jgi:hypothetical protein